jgi:lipopolysaccharide transport system permease protein
MTDRLSPPSQLRLLWQDARDSLTHWRFWFYLGLEDILKQYRRSFLGPVWISLNTAVFIVAFSFVGSQIFRIQLHDYLVYFCVGNVVFLYMSSLVTEGCHTFIAAEAFLKQTPYPKLVFVLRVVWRSSIAMAHNLPVLLTVLLLYGDVAAIRLGALVLGFALTVIAGALLAACLGAVCARFRDVPLLVASVMQISMFLTPVMWKPEQLAPQAMTLVHYNPLAAFLDLVRAPLMGNMPSPQSYTMAMTVLGVLLVGYFSLFLYSRRRLVYWL